MFRILSPRHPCIERKSHSRCQEASDRPAIGLDCACFSGVPGCENKNADRNGQHDERHVPWYHEIFYDPDRPADRSCDSRRVRCDMFTDLLGRAMVYGVWVLVDVFVVDLDIL